MIIFMVIDDRIGMKRIGLVHISQLANHRVDNVETIVTQGQQVWVKVIGTPDEKIILSMKECNQITGHDLNHVNNGGEPDTTRPTPPSESTSSALSTPASATQTTTASTSDMKGTRSNKSSIRVMIIPVGMGITKRQCIMDQFDVMDMTTIAALPEPAEDPGLYSLC
jgi:predicted RNA-binding protein with RPS1 domain